VRDNAISGWLHHPQRVLTHDIAEHDTADDQQAGPDLLECSITRKIAKAGPFCRFVRQNLVVDPGVPRRSKRREAPESKLLSVLPKDTMFKHNPLSFVRLCR
jgi:hypothetical protein